MAMKSGADIRPTDRKMSARTIALGTVACLALASGFFFAGLWGLGPLLRQYLNPNPRTEQAIQVPSSTPTEQSPSEAPSAEQTQLDVQITEEGENQQTSPSDQALSSDSGVKQDESGLTVTLEPKGDARKPASPAPAEKEKAVSPRDAGTQPQTPVSGSRAYRVQAGTFANRTNAENIAADLKQRGYKPEIKPVQREAGTLYRVEMGSFKTREGAQDLVDDLSRKGYSPTISAEHKPE